MNRIQKSKNTISNMLLHFGEALKGEERDYTQGSINKALYMLAIPMMLEMIMESLFAVVDVFFVGRIGVNAVATVGLTESIMTIFYSVAIGLSMATTALVARRIGEKDPRTAAKTAFQSLSIATIISLSIGIPAAIYAPEILGLMGASQDVINEGTGFMRVMMGGNIVVMMLFLINGIFRGAGNAAIAMRSLWLANICNIILCPIFIFGFGPIPAFGVMGSAIATTTGRSVGVLYQLYHLFGGKSIIKIHREDIQWIPDIIKKLFSIAFGGMVQFLIGSASWIFLVRIVSLFGSDALAGYTIAIRIVIFTILPSWGLANAAATLVGQNLGAKQPERAEQSVWKAAKYNMFFLLIVSIIFFISADHLIGWFNKDPEVVQYGVKCLKYVCLGYIMFAYGMVISQSFNGAGDTKTPTIINLIGYWFIQIPLAYLFAVILDFGAEGAFMAITSAEIILAIMFIWIFRKGKWKLIQV